MLLLIAGLNFSMAMLQPASGYAGLNLLIGAICLAVAFHTGVVMTLREMKATKR